MEVRVIKSEEQECKSCSGRMYFNIKSGVIMCESCGLELEPEYGYNEVKKGFDHTNTEDDPVTEVVNICICDNCAAEIELEPSVVTATCPFCDSTHTTVNTNQKVIKPTCLVPYEIEMNECDDIFKKWLKKQRKSKRKFRKEATISKFVKTYRPYWIFDAVLDSKYELSYIGGEKRGDKTTITTLYYGGVVNIQAIDILVDGKIQTKYYDHVDYERVNFENYDLNKLVPLDNSYLSDTVSTHYTIDLDDGFFNLKAYVADLIRESEFKRVKGLKKRLRSFDLRNVQSSYLHGLFPVYEATIDFEGKEYRFEINGQTGEANGEIELSWLHQR